MKIKVEFNILMSDDEIDDIICCAFEGGINYWCDYARPIGKGKRIGAKTEYLGQYASDNISRGGNIVLRDNEECDIYGKPKHYLLTPTKFVRAIKELTKRGKLPVYTVKDHVRIDTSSVDANIADMIIQVALFGDVIYG